MNFLTPFHLAIPVTNLAIAQDFYKNTLECTPGRFSKQWADYSLFGHQLVLHEDKKYKGQKHFNEVDGKSVPIPHFGVVLKWRGKWNESWDACLNSSKNGVFFVWLLS